MRRESRKARKDKESVRQPGQSKSPVGSPESLTWNLNRARARQREVERSLVPVPGRIRKAVEQVAVVAARLEHHEAAAEKALATDDRTVALQEADEIARLDAELQRAQRHLGKLEAKAQALQKMAERSRWDIAEFERQLEMIRPSGSVQKATTAITADDGVARDRIFTGPQLMRRLRDHHRRQEELLRSEQAAAELNAEKALNEKLGLG